MHASAVFVKNNFGKIPTCIKRLEKKGATIYDVIYVFNYIKSRIQLLPPGDERQKLAVYYQKNVLNNPGFKAVHSYLYNGAITDKLTRWSREELQLVVNVPIANDEIERIFSVSKAFYRSNRMAFNFGNLRLKLLAMNIMKKVIFNLLLTKICKIKI